MYEFIDHKSNIFVVNDEYEHRKGIAGALHKQYLWRNQSLMSLDTSLHKQFSFIPKPSYNAEARSMLDKFYALALLLCTQDFPISVHERA